MKTQYVVSSGVLVCGLVLSHVLSSEASSGNSGTCTEDVVNAECFTAPFSWKANTCCGQLSASSVGECRTRDLEVPANVLEASDVTLKMSVGYDSVAASESCGARVCTVFGDPEGIAFGSSMVTTYIPCDGRIESGKKQCRMDKDTCQSRRGPDNSACLWRPKKGEDWVVAERGSPCVAAVDPSITVYKISDVLEITAKVGERGIIKEVTISDLGSPETTVTAASCFQDPVGTASALPGNAASTLSGEGGVRTYGVALSCGSFELSCIQMLTTGDVDGQQYRIDLNAISIDESAAQVAAAGHTESGFCVTGKFVSGAWYDVGVENPDTFVNLHGTCVNKNLPTISACRFFSDHTCTHSEVGGVIDTWCDDNAEDIRCGNYAQLGPAKRVRKCKADLAEMAALEQNGEESSSRWAKLYSCTKYPKSVKKQSIFVNCVQDFSWEQCVSEMEDSGVALVCEQEVCIGHEDPGTGNFVSALCASEQQSGGDALTLTKAEFPALFANLETAKVSQCGLSAACIARSSAPVPGIDVTVEFESPDQDPESCSLDDDFEAPAVCEAGATDVVTLGSCDTQCEVENLCGVCRTLEMEDAYCDPTDDSSAGRLACSKLKEKGGRLDISLVRDEAASEVSCCKTCQAWGDPYFAAFDGTILDQLLCDGRKKVGKKSCEVKRDVCESKVDHAGNQCKYSDSRAAQLATLTPSDIGVVGSACQPDWTATNSFAPNVTLFELSDVKVNIITGERSIISEVKVAVDGIWTKLAATDCFNTDFAALSTADLVIHTEDAVCPNGAKKCGGRTTERRVLAAAADKGLLLELRCVRAFAGKKHLEGGWRFNIDALTSTDMVRVGDATGLCNVPMPYKQQWTDDFRSVALQDEICGETTGSLLTACKDIYDYSCTPSHYVEAITQWCAVDAQLSDSDRVACRKKITGPGFGNVKAQKKTRGQWINFFCKQFDSKSQKACKKDYTKFLGVELTAAVPCASSVAEYKARPKNDCETGVSVKYLDADSGSLVEALFVPDSLPLCAGATLSFDAKNYPKLFTSKIVFENCGLDADLCPMLGHVDAHCAPSNGFEATMQFNQDQSFCTDQA